MEELCNFKFRMIEALTIPSSRTMSAVRKYGGIEMFGKILGKNPVGIDVTFPVTVILTPNLLVWLNRFSEASPGKIGPFVAVTFSEE